VRVGCEDRSWVAGQRDDLGRPAAQLGEQLRQHDAGCAGCSDMQRANLLELDVGDHEDRAHGAVGSDAHRRQQDQVVGVAGVLDRRHAGDIDVTGDDRRIELCRRTGQRRVNSQGPVHGEDVEEADAPDAQAVGDLLALSSGDLCRGIAAA